MEMYMGCRELSTKGRKKGAPNLTELLGLHKFQMKTSAWNTVFLPFSLVWEEQNRHRMSWKTISITLRNMHACPTCNTCGRSLRTSLQFPCCHWYHRLNVWETAAHFMSLTDTSGMHTVSSSVNMDSKYIGKKNNMAFSWLDEPINLMLFEIFKL